MPWAVRIDLVQHLAGIVVDHDVRIGRLIIGAVQETVVAMVDALLGFGPFAVLGLGGRTGLDRGPAERRHHKRRRQNDRCRTMDAPPASAGAKDRSPSRRTRLPAHRCATHRRFPQVLE